LPLARPIRAGKGKLMRWTVFVFRMAALATAVWALGSRASCAVVTGSCLGSNLFSYFTVHSAFLFILAVLVAACYTLFTDSEPAWLTALRAMAVTYTVVSGVVFAALLANATLFDYLFLVPLSSKVLHFVLPFYAVADFLFGPCRHRLGWSTAWLAMVFPLLWAAYTLVRGEMVGWYPYFFLDPGMVGGYQTVGIYAVSLSGLILFIALATVAASRLPSTSLRWRHRRRIGPGSSSPTTRASTTSAATSMAGLVPRHGSVDGSCPQPPACGDGTG
jgi:hypothetical protein